MRKGVAPLLASPYVMFDFGLMMDLKRLNEIMTGSAAQDRGNPVWQFFRSVKLTLALLIILAVTSIIGTLVPQKEDTEIEFVKV